MKLINFNKNIIVIKFINIYKIISLYILTKLNNFVFKIKYIKIMSIDQIHLKFSLENDSKLKVFSKPTNV